MDPARDDYKYIVLGDSISKGVIFDEGKERYVVSKNNYVSLLENKIKGVICNFSKFGATITKGVKRLNSIVTEQKADIVLIEYGGNDCDFKWDEVADNPRGNHLPNTDLHIFKKVLEETINTLKINKLVPVLMTLPPLNADSYLKWVSKNNPLLESNILKWLGSVTKIYWWQERYSSVIVKVAEETQTRWIDVREAFLSHADYTKFLCLDGIHPNEAGQRLIAEKILYFLKKNYCYLIKDETYRHIGGIENAEI